MAASDFGLSASASARPLPPARPWMRPHVDGDSIALNDFADATGTSVENAWRCEDVALRTGPARDRTAAAGQVQQRPEGPEDAGKGCRRRIFRHARLALEDFKSHRPGRSARRQVARPGQFADDGAKARAIAVALFGKAVKELIADAQRSRRGGRQATRHRHQAADRRRETRSTSRSSALKSKGITSSFLAASASRCCRPMAKAAPAFAPRPRHGKGYFDTLTTEYWKRAEQWMKAGQSPSPVSSAPEAGARSRASRSSRGRWPTCAHARMQPLGSAGGGRGRRGSSSRIDISGLPGDTPAEAGGGGRTARLKEDTQRDSRRSQEEQTQAARP